MNEKMSQVQLEHLAALLRPGIARTLGEPAEETVICITSSDANLLRFEVRVRGQEISPEQETRVLAFVFDRNGRRV